MVNLLFSVRVTVHVAEEKEIKIHYFMRKHVKMVAEFFGYIIISPKISITTIFMGIWLKIIHICWIILLIILPLTRYIPVYWQFTKMPLRWFSDYILKSCSLCMNRRTSMQMHEIKWQIVVIYARAEIHWK